MKRIRKLLTVQDREIELYCKKLSREQVRPNWLTFPCATMPLMPQKALTYAFVFWIQTLTCWDGGGEGKKKKEHEPTPTPGTIKPLLSPHILPSHTCASSS